MIWSLPGPARFVGRAERACRDGDHLVLLIPMNAASGIGSELQRRLGDEWHWRNLAARAENAVAPNEVCLEALGLATRPGILPTPEWLAGHDAVAGTILSIQDITQPDATGPWLAFLDRFRHASLQRPALERPLIILLLRGPAAAVATEAREVAVRTLRWAGLFRLLDARLLTACVSDEGEAGLEATLAAEIAAHLSPFDLDFAIGLAGLPLEALLDPVPVLRGHAATSGWLDLKEPDWASGSLDQVDGTPTVHPAYLAVKGDPRDEIRLRLWTGQLSILLPHIERLRRKFAAQVAHRLPLPFTTADGRTISVADDLEVGELLYLSRLSKTVDAPTLRKLDGLRLARNALAHGQPLSAAAVSRLLGSGADCSDRALWPG